MKLGVFQGSFQQMWISKQEYDEGGKSCVEKKCPWPYNVLQLCNGSVLELYSWTVFKLNILIVLKLDKLKKHI